MKNDKTIDLNADLGEYSNEDELNNEISLIHHITSANIACGGHAGDQVSIRNIINHCVSPAGYTSGDRGDTGCCLWH